MRKIGVDWEDTRYRYPFDRKSGEICIPKGMYATPRNLAKLINATYYPNGEYECKHYNVVLWFIIEK